MCWISLRKWTDSNIGLDDPSVLQSTASCSTSVTQLTLWSIKLAFFHCEQIEKRKGKLACQGFFFCVFFKRSYSIIGSQRLHPVLAVRASACSSCASKYGCLVTDSSLAFYRESVRSTTKLCSLSRCQALNMKDYIRSAGDVRVSEWLVGWTDGLNDTRVFSIMPVNTGWWIKHWTVLRFIVHNRRISAEVPQPFSPRRVYWRYPNDF